MRKNLSYFTPLLVAAAAIAFAPIAAADDAPPPCATCVDVWAPAAPPQPDQGAPPPTVAQDQGAHDNGFQDGNGFGFGDVYPPPPGR
jgi:hypothetical protein